MATAAISVTATISVIAGGCVTKTIAPDRSVRESAVGVHHTFWEAIATGDTSKVRTVSVPDVSLTLSDARTFTSGQIYPEIAAYRLGATRMEWLAEDARAHENSVVVRSRLREVTDANVSSFQIMTVLVRTDGEWKVAAAQSTREPYRAPTITVASSLLNDLAGRYRTARGGLISVIARDNALGVVETDGREYRYEPVGGMLFEARNIPLSSGVIRLVFIRDDTGAVVGMNRILQNGITTLTRVLE
jgi:hypothetical protein